MASRRLSKSELITKEIINDNSNVFGNVQRLTFENYEGTINQYLKSIALPITAPYVIGMRVKKVSGTCNIQIGVNGQYNKYLNNVIPEGEEIIIFNNKPQQIIDKNTILEPLIQIENPQNLVLDVSECFIIPRKNNKVWITFTWKMSKTRTNINKRTYICPFYIIMLFKEKFPIFVCSCHIVTPFLAILLIFSIYLFGILPCPMSSLASI